MGKIAIFQESNSTQPQKPHILCSPRDSVSLSIAESDSRHFHALIADHAKDATDVYQLCQDWPNFRVASDGTTQAIPLLTLRVTIFPYQGLSIGLSFLHVAVDGPAFHHFVKSWASICKGQDFDGPTPVHDRTVVRDPNGLESTILQLQWSMAGPINFGSEPISKRLADMVRATFELSKAQIEGLKSWARAESPHFSSFVAVCSLVWVCFIKSREGEGGNGKGSEVCCFAFAADCRKRLGYPMPAGYFGNCLAFCHAVVEKGELLGGDGVIVGMKATGKRVGEAEDEPLKETAEWASVWKKYKERGVVFAVAGSPRLGAYDVDFGWGRPIKTDVIHIDSGSLFSLGESRNENGGIEVGLALSTAHMARFVAVWEQTLNLFSC
ncbi:coumaroyl-CoA:anthocyanidin 3-O-glucoside-6''-O-coumaroyltransferase 2-like [Momordica charantia]|uniref:Coumaroyl-CoA:anthocyanidin 3-O-glucoside-6''-O-coumaroyltransferase 2-like n=1 Tax=Momordica charantia TaxID=3673 RepID=A0A6J1CIE1_MOMCH|nr:coumaroyl-CoA:anthocyanidin 3-O-glucoside-6''-O-coumaroyltransferase 2-like [Momordica charantia]